ncbi:MAG: histidine kinase [Flavobacteriales bacterium]|nr:histidine kinase [Flavobacteriales bacterium]
MKNLPLFLTVLINGSIIAQQPFIKEVELLGGMEVSAIEQDGFGLIHFLSEDSHYSFDGVELHIESTLAEDDKWKSIQPLGRAMTLATESGFLIIQDVDETDTIEFEIGIGKTFTLGNDSLLTILENGKVNLVVHSSSDIIDIEAPLDIGLTNAVISTSRFIFFATDRGLWYSSREFDKWNLIDHTKGKIINSIILKDDQSLWLGGHDGSISELQLNTFFIQPIHHCDNPVKKLIRADDRIFILNGDMVAEVQVNPAISSDSLFFWDQEGILDMFLDDERNLWAINSKKVYKASLHYSKWSKIPDAEIRAMGQQDGELYYGTDQGVFNDAISIEEPIFSANISSLAIEKNIKAYGTFNEGLFVVNSEYGSNNPIRVEGLDDNTVLAVAIVDSTRLLVTTLAGTHYINIDDQKISVSESLKGLDTYYILSIHSLDNGEILFGTDKRGLVIYNSEGIRSINVVDGISIGTVHSIADSEGSIYLTTSEAGLLIYNGEELSTVPCPHEVWSEYTSIIPVDNSEFLLVGSQEVALFDPSKGELLAFDEDIDLDQARAFNNNHVSIGNRVLFQQASEILCYHHSPQPYRRRSLTRLTAVEANLESVHLSQHSLEEDQNNLRFHFSGVLYRNPEKIIYQYILDGFDTEWRETKDRSVSYPHLPPGRYTFRVRSGHDHNLTDADEVNYAFEIKQIFYRTNWFRYLILFFSLGIGFLIWRKRIENKRIQERLELLQTRSRLMGLKAQINPHFLFNNFNTIIGLTEEDPERSVEFTEKLTDFYRMVIEQSDQELISIESEIELIDTYLELLSIRFDDSVTIVKQGKFEGYQIPPMTLQLLIENAVKHNKALSEEPLEILIIEEEEYLLVTHKKNPRPSIKGSLGVGLSNLRLRYQLLYHKEVIVIDDNQTFTVKLPRTNSRA